MSRSFFKQPKEVPIATEVLVGNVMKCRWGQYRHRARFKKQGDVKKTGKAKIRMCRPPVEGWYSCTHTGTGLQIQKCCFTGVHPS